MTVQLPTQGKVKQARLLKTVPGKDGKPDASVWKVRIEVGDQFIDAELFGGEEPAPGTELSVEASNYGPKAKRVRRGGGGGFRGGPRPDDPATRDSIERQVAVKAVAEVYGRAGKIPTADEVLAMTAAFLEAMRSKAA